MTAGEKTLCCETACDYQSRWPRFHPCRNAAKVERDGKPYCGIHDPVARKEKATTKKNERDLVYRRQRERELRSEIAVELLDAVVAAKTDAATLTAAKKARSSLAGLTDRIRKEMRSR